MHTGRIAFHGVLVFSLLSSAAAWGYPSHGRSGGLTTGQKWGLGIAGALTGYAIGRAIHNRRERDYYRAQWEAAQERERANARYVGGYYDDDSSDYVPSPVDVPSQTKVNEIDIKDALSELNDVSVRALGGAALDAFNGPTPKFACFALCGGYWNGEYFSRLSYDDNYYGKALMFSQVFTFGNTRASAFEALKNSCPGFHARLVDPGSYSSKTIYKQPLREANEDGVCFENTAGNASCTGHCTATRKGTTDKPVESDVTGRADSIGKAYLSLVFSEDCMGKYGLVGGPYSYSLAHPTKETLSPQNSCKINPGAPATQSAHVTPPATPSVITPAHTESSPPPVTTAATKETPFAGEAQVSCDGPLCDLIRDQAPASKNCVQALKKEGSDSLWIRFTRGRCPSDQTKIVPPGEDSFELRATSADDPQFSQSVANDEQARKRMQDLHIPMPRSGKIMWKNPEGKEVAIGEWFELNDGRSNHYPMITSLCTQKREGAPPNVGVPGEDYSKVCRIDMRDGYYQGIVPR